MFVLYVDDGIVFFEDISIVQTSVHQFLPILLTHPPHTPKPAHAHMHAPTAQGEALKFYTLLDNSGVGTPESTQMSESQPSFTKCLASAQSGYAYVIISFVRF